jgi:predicted amidophosphoribosyltransferase
VPSLQKLNTPESSFIEMPSSRPFLHNLLKRALPSDKISRAAFVFDFARKGKQNKALKEAERFQRIAETLKLSGRPLPEAKMFILCDDVFTTGATLGHAAWLLQQKLALEPAQIQLWSLMYRPRQFEDEQN